MISSSDGERLILDEETQQRLKGLVASIRRPFTQRALIAGLDPAFDLQYANLRNVDLTDSDLRGFNLANADLTGAWGRAVRWDHTTNLQGAIVTSSIFAHREGLRRFFASNTDAANRLTGLRRQSDTDKITWAADHVRRGAPNQAANLPVAQALYLEAEGAFLKAQLLFFMSPALSHQELKDFALGIIAERSDSAAIIRSMMDILNLHRLTEDKQLRRAIMSLLASPNYDVRDSALRWLAQRRLSDDEFDIIRPMLVADERLGGIYVAAVARRHGEVHELAVREPMSNAMLGIQAEVTVASLLRIAMRWKEAEKSQEHPGRLVEKPYTRQRQIGTDSLRKERANAILRCWTDLRKDHVHIWLAGHRDN